MPGLTGELLGDARNDGATYVKPRKLFPATGVPIGVPTGESSGVRSVTERRHTSAPASCSWEAYIVSYGRRSPREGVRTVMHQALHENGQAAALRTSPQLVEVVGTVCAGGAGAVR